MSTGTDDQPPLERLVELTLFGPIDLTARVVQDLPNTVDKARRQLVLARFVGRLAVEQGVRELRRRVEGTAEPQLAPVDSDQTGSACEPGDVTRGSVADPEATRGELDHGDGAGEELVVATVDDLALPDYEQLPAAHVVAKLAGLTQPERDAIEAFELAHRHRRTVLGKLDQLRDPG